MFLLNRENFHVVDMSVVSDFVTCWEHYYRGAISVSPTNNQAIDYFSELNLLGDLTVDNVTRLLRWKDPRMLTHPKLAEGATADNPRVVRVLNHLDTLNEFRHGNIDQEAFTKAIRKVFPNGPIWRQFLFHVARPWEWPIADQHVFRAHTVLFGVDIPLTLAGFQRYRNSFMKLAHHLDPTVVDGADHSAIVAVHKRLDNALMAYGQFLRAYDR